MASDERVRAVLGACDLHELKRALSSIEGDGEAMAAVARLRLPTFGGERPRGVLALSYDAERLLVVDPEDGSLRVVSRFDERLRAFLRG